jgi:uridine kinase
MLGLVPLDAASQVVDLARLRDRSPTIVALDGRSGAGKTTLAASVASRLEATLIDGDDFYRDLPERDRLCLGPADGARLYFDWERLRDQVLGPLSRGRSASYRPFDWISGHGLTKEPVHLAASAFVVLDGVYSARPELAGYVDATVLVETDLEERAKRLAARGHGHASWVARWEAAEDIYFTEIRPPSAFDVIVRGE